MTEGSERPARAGRPSRAAACGALLSTLAIFVGCGGRMPDDLGVTAGRLRPCPDSPNCVSSFATDAQHAIDAFVLEGSAAAAWGALESELEGRDDVEIQQRSASYLHAVFTTPLMRYRDDVEFALRSDEGAIDVRSASRVGYGDMDANRNRIESLRAALATRGVVRGAGAVADAR